MRPVASLHKSVKVHIMSKITSSSSNMQIFVLALILTLCITQFNAAKLPTYIQPCSRNDPELNECAKRKGNAALDFFVTKGDRKYNIPVLDPLLITKMTIQQSGLNLEFEDMQLAGMKNSQITAVRIDLKNQHQEFDLQIPLLDITAKYTASGRILILPISGSGNNRITLTDVQTTFSHDFDLKKKKNGKLHMVTRNNTFVSTPKLMTLSMDNLFNGDKALGDNMNLVMNENWRELHREIGPAFNSALGQVAEQILNGMTDLVPYDEMYPETV